jgi:hypothetical protein
LRDLAQPKVLSSAVTAALASCVAGYPRLAQWTGRQHPIWFLVTVLFVCAWVLWAFVLAWHDRYLRRPVVAKNLELKVFGMVTGIGVVIGAIHYFYFDPIVKAKMPDAFPTTLPEWVGMTLFSLAFQQLFLVFAPLAFFSRILNSGRLAIILTVFFGGLIIMAKAQPAMASMPWLISSGFLVVRMVAGLLTIYFYLRGGIVLAYWWGLILQSRELFDLS